MCTGGMASSLANFVHIGSIGSSLHHHPSWLAGPSNLGRGSNCRFCLLQEEQATVRPPGTAYQPLVIVLDPKITWHDIHSHQDTGWNFGRHQGDGPYKVRDLKTKVVQVISQRYLISLTFMPETSTLCNQDRWVWNFWPFDVFILPKPWNVSSFPHEEILTPTFISYSYILAWNHCQKGKRRRLVETKDTKSKILNDSIFNNNL